MNRSMRMLAAAIVAAAVTLWASAQDATPHRAPAGSVAAQLRLKSLLQAQQSEGSLMAALNHNAQDWGNLSPDQREEYRKNVVAFLNKSPEEQEKLLQHYEQLVKLSAEAREKYRLRAKWIQAVLNTMTDAEKKQLRELSPEERAKKLLERRDELVKKGVLVLEEPTTTSAPATSPAK